jgi:hypothetical protein
VTTGPSKEFPMTVNRLAIAQIANMTPGPEVIPFIASGAPKEDVDAAIIILNLVEYLKARHVQPDFKVVLSE